MQRDRGCSHNRPLRQQRHAVGWFANRVLRRALDCVGLGDRRPFFSLSEDWQLLINTGTTIITFLMVFLIQQSQNKDSVATHLKLNELLASSRNASNRMIGIEELDEHDLRDVATFYARLSERAKTSGSRKEMHSIDEEGMPASSGSGAPNSASAG